MAGTTFQRAFNPNLVPSATLPEQAINKGQLDAKGIISVKDAQFGAKGDGVTDDTAAIQAAINYAAASVINPPVDKARRVRVPHGDYLITSPLQTYSGVWLEGEGHTSRLVGSGLVSGQGIVELAAATYCAEAKITGLGFYCATQGVRAIKAVATRVLSCDFKDLRFETSHCLQLDTYAQSCVIDGLYSLGNCDQLLRLVGNWNDIILIDKEGGTGVTSEPYVEILTGGLTTNSYGNTIRAFLCEGSLSANKPVIKATTVARLVIGKMFVQGSSNTVPATLLTLDGTDAELADLVAGFPQAGFSLTNASRLKLGTIDFNDTNRNIYDLYPFFTLGDAFSLVSIERLDTRQGWGLTRNPQVTIKRVAWRSQIDTSHFQGVRGEFDVAPVPGEDMFVKGGSFENAADADNASGGPWHYPANLFSAITYPQSEMNPITFMFKGVIQASPTSGAIYRSFDVPAGSVGRVMEIEGWAKIVGANTWVEHRVNALNIGNSHALGGADGNKGWQLLRLSVVLQTADTGDQYIIDVKGATAGDIVYLDRFRAWLI